jgi:hypothetical protein
MKRHLTIAIVLAVLALFAAACGGDDGGDDDAAPPDDSATTQPEDPQSALIADKALLTADDFPAWWSEVEVDSAMGQVLVESEVSCERMIAVESGSGPLRNARSGPVAFAEVEGVRSVQLSIFTYDDVAAAEKFMADLEAADLTGCLTNLFSGLWPDGLTGPVTEQTLPFGDQTIAATVPLKANKDYAEDVNFNFVWTRVDRAVAFMLAVGPPAENYDQYANTVSTRLSQELATT